MKINKKWVATSKKAIEVNNSLLNLVGVWNIGIDVRIEKPYIYTKGSVEIKGEIK